MGDLIPLFQTQDIHFTLSAAQRVRFEALQEKLRFRYQRDVLVAALALLSGYFEKPHDEWMLVVVQGERVIEVELHPYPEAIFPPRRFKRFIMFVVNVLEAFARGLRWVFGLSRREEQVLPCLLEGKEYKIRCSHKGFQAIRKMQDLYVKAGWPSSVDNVMIRAIAFLELLVRYRSQGPVKLMFQRRDRSRNAQEILWEEFLDGFEHKK